MGRDYYEDALDKLSEWEDTGVYHCNRLLKKILRFREGRLVLDITDEGYELLERLNGPYGKAVYQIWKQNNKQRYRNWVCWQLKVRRLMYRHSANMLF